MVETLLVTVGLVLGVMGGYMLGAVLNTPPLVILPEAYPDDYLVISPVVVAGQNGAIFVHDKDSGRKVQFAGVQSATWAFNGQRLVAILDNPPVTQIKQPVTVEAAPCL